MDELCFDGVKVLKPTGKNNFAAKQLLSETDTYSNYLVYNPISYSDVRDNWLLDIELYSEEFRADLLSIRMQELGMSPTSQMRKAMKSYSKFFDNKERMARLSTFKSSYTNVGQLHIDILAVLAGTSANTAPGVIRAILMDGMDIESNDAITNIRKFGNESVLWEMINRYTGYLHLPEQKSLIGLASHILITALSVTMKASCLSGLEKLISEPHQQRCYDLINEWLHSEEDDEALYDIAREVEAYHHLEKRFDALDVQEVLTRRWKSGGRRNGISASSFTMTGCYRSHRCSGSIRATSVVFILPNTTSSGKNTAAITARWIISIGCSMRLSGAA